MGRMHCIETILHTDMVGHTGMGKDLTLMYQMNYEVFTKSGESVGNSNVADQQAATSSRWAEIEVFSRPDEKKITMDCILHSADVSNPCRAWEVTQAWAAVCLEEFFTQGDQEKMLGIPVQFLNDREKLNKPNSQIGFIEFMIAPFYAAQIRLWPGLHELGDNLGRNIRSWEDMWVQQLDPSEEEKQKV